MRYSQPLQLLRVMLILMLLMSFDKSQETNSCKDSSDNNSECIPVAQPTSSNPNQPQYDFVVVAVFKDEEFYMEEWLDHYIQQGFQHIYLYCNDPETHKYPYLFSPSKYTPYLHYCHSTSTAWR